MESKIGKHFVFVKGGRKGTIVKLTDVFASREVDYHTGDVIQHTWLVLSNPDTNRDVCRISSDEFHYLRDLDYQQFLNI